MIVDTDTHVEVSLDELARFMDQPIRREVEGAMPGSLLPGTLGAPAPITGPARPDGPAAEEGAPEADYRVVFPGLVLSMTFHPSVRLERGVATAYARWLAEVYLPAQPGARGLLYLPIRDAEAACRLVEDFGGVPGIAGAFVTNLPALQPFDNRNMRLYRTLEERRLPLAFHPVLLWTEPPLTVFDNYTAAYAYAHPFTQTAHLMNWILSGMPERFPDLACVFYGAGVAWLNFVAHRLDQGYMRRPSEAPLLKERPSHYMRRCFYTTQPLDVDNGAGYLKATIALIGSGQFLYGSNFPQWDFDTPDAVRGLEWLSGAERAAILGANAARLFGLPTAPIARTMDERAVCRSDEVAPDHVTLVKVDGIEVGLLRVADAVVAFENVCPHQGGPVCDGEVLSRVEAVLDSAQHVVRERFAEHRHTLICPWHGYSFDIATGECVTDRKIRLRRWESRERDGLVYLTGRRRTPAAIADGETPGGR